MDPVAVPVVEGAGAPRSRWEAAWLFSPARDLGLLAVPVACTAAAALWATLRPDPDAFGEAKLYAGWMSQFILGNSTHVILTFLLLWARRDVLQATDRQARVVIGGSLAVFALVLGVTWGVERSLPLFTDFVFAVLLIFATHHALSQVKGIWSLYNLRGGKAGLGQPSPAERTLLTNFVPIGLLFTMVKLLLVPKDSRALALPFLSAIPGAPGEPAVLPFAATYVLLGLWAVFSIAALRELLSAPAVHVAKAIYVTVHLTVVGITLVAPAWGTILTSGIHGLEYFVLCGRMLEPTAADRGAGLPRAMVIPAMIGVMLPLFFVGLGNGPFGHLLAADRHAGLFHVARLVLNGVVIAHYFADAFIYRFRVPEIRRVALSRLGFAS